MYEELIIDVESLSIQPEAALLAIGAVAFSFDHDDMQLFHLIIDKESSTASGGVTDHSTLKWWEKQSEEARKIFTDPNRVDLKEAMTGLQRFCIKTRNSNPRKQLNVWGNDNSFDVVICERSFQRLNMAVPWNYYEGRSVRTLVDIGQRLGINPKAEIKRTGIHHNALDDCLHEIKYCREIMKFLKG